MMSYNTTNNLADKFPVFRLINFIQKQSVTLTHSVMYISILANKKTVYNINVISTKFFKNLANHRVIFNINKAGYYIHKYIIARLMRCCKYSTRLMFCISVLFKHSGKKW